MIALLVCAAPPSRGSLETNPFGAIDCAWCPDKLLDLEPLLVLRHRERPQDCSFLGRGSYTPRQRIHCSATPILHVSQWMAWRGPALA